jgi:four helix bundle protein
MKSQDPKSQVPDQSQVPSPKAAKPYDLKERTFQFALRVLDIAAALPDGPEARVVREQLAAAGTSIGANVEEADAGMSKADCRKCFKIARKEARETRYWLRLLRHRWGAAMASEEDVVEATELIHILSAIIAKLE